MPDDFDFRPSAGGQESPSGTGTAPGSPQESAQSTPQTGQGDDPFPLIAAIVGGILAALLTAIIIRILVVRRRRKKSITRKYKNSGRGSRQRNYRR